MKNYSKSTIIITLFVIFLSVGYTNMVFACSYSPNMVPLTPQNFLEESTHVFAGKVLSVTNTQSTNIQSTPLHTVTFEVLKYWKGDIKKYIQVSTRVVGTSCDLPLDFVVDEEYLVYAYYSSYDNVLLTNNTMLRPGAQPLKDAGTHLAVLGQGSVPMPIVNPFQSSNYVFSRNLRLGSQGEDVKNLQRYLNSNGFVVSASGLGSLGNETTYFGYLTKAALIKFQNAHLVQLGISQGTGYFGPLTRNLIQTLGGIAN